MSIALSVFQTVWGLVVLLGLTFSRPVVSVCEGFGEVTCTGDPSDAWVNSNFAGQSLPPAGTMIHCITLIMSYLFFWVAMKDQEAKLDYKCTTRLSYEILLNFLFFNLQF
jgi:hypothetical protein